MLPLNIFIRKVFKHIHFLNDLEYPKFREKKLILLYIIIIHEIFNQL